MCVFLHKISFLQVACITNRQERILQAVGIWKLPHKPRQGSAICKRRQNDDIGSHFADFDNRWRSQLGQHRTVSIWHRCLDLRRTVLFAQPHHLHRCRSCRSLVYLSAVSRSRDLWQDRGLKSKADAPALWFWAFASAFLLFCPLWQKFFSFFYLSFIKSSWQKPKIYL